MMGLRLPLQLVPRETPSRAMVWVSPVVALAATLAAGALLFAVMGTDPWQGLRVFLLEPLMTRRGWSELALKATPLILCGVGLALCFRANVWNIGAEGQLIAGAIAGGGVALLATPESTRAFVPLVIASAALGGALWASITAWLRDRFHANEILVSLMLVYVAQLLLSWLVHGAWRDPDGFGFPQSKLFEAAARMPVVVEGTRLNIGFPLGLAAAAVFWLMLARMVIGFQLKVVGQAPLAARYAGYSNRKALWFSLLVTGALAGVAGGIEATGPVGQLTPTISPGYGFAAIIVAFVGRLHPVGVVLAALLMALFYIGGELAQSRLGLPPALTGVYQGLLLFFLLACDTLIAYRLRWRRAVTVVPA
jgi:general nucleoside transport system permease protein